LKEEKKTQREMQKSTLELILEKDQEFRRSDLGKTSTTNESQFNQMIAASTSRDMSAFLTRRNGKRKREVFDSENMNMMIGKVVHEMGH